MSTESTGRGEPDRTLALLWRDRLGEPTGSRGPKQRSSVDEVVSTAIQLADEEGIEAVSMRRIADRLGLKPMSVYTYVPGKAELIDLMFDQVAGEQELPPHTGSSRERLERIARIQWRDYLRHPWLLTIDTSRPPLGPNVSDRWEWALTAIEGLGLTDLDMDQVITLVVGYVSGPARAFVDAERLLRATDESDQEWWERNAPILEQVMEPGRYEISGRVGQAAGEAYAAAADPARAFEFGLARIIDGIESYIADVGETRAGKTRAGETRAGEARLD
ncbi:TetR/AcrR family transcriptional regulator [Agromyces albus]|uniref:TetR/AcrR family transcriptional regulator n=1 Tax=Agromyces albus TaxID=205332 RepID=UPI0027878C33|nr:TetR/AcrR family transcriptional regulator [Agromyces albus]MDQ0576554.1 AcrR family transcriptional regulator [Agromyces albus]